MNEISMKSTLGELVNDLPRLTRLFDELDIDYVGRPELTLAEACAAAGLDAETLVQVLLAQQEEPQPPLPEDLQELSLTELTTYLADTHHEALRGLLPRLEELEREERAAPGNPPEEESELQRALRNLTEALDEHLRQEEEILYPAVREMEAIAGQPDYPFGSIGSPIREAAFRLEELGGVLERVRELTGGFVAPHDASEARRELYGALHTLESVLRNYADVENNLLFPRALKEESQRSSSPQA